VKQRGELYYIFLDRSRDFRGYATFDLPGGQTHMRVNGRDSGDSITVEFEQPARQVTLGPGLSGEIRAFEFTIHFRQVDRGEYEGDFAHPEFEDTSDPFLIGKSKLQMV
jgi:hypothetical protein